MITLIAAIDLNYGMAANGKLLAMVPEDMIHFKEKTLGKIVVMGRTTWLSLPLRKQKPLGIYNTNGNLLKEASRDTHALKGRFNIVISHKKNEELYGTSLIVDNIDDILELAETNNIFIIGGASIYEQFYQYADVIELTVFDKVFEEADLFFPTIYYDEFKVQSSRVLERENDFNLFFFTIVRIT